MDGKGNFNSSATFIRCGKGRQNGAGYEGHCLGEGDLNKCREIRGSRLAKGIDFENICCREESLSANELKRLLHSHGLKPQDAVRIDSSAVSERCDADGETRPLMGFPAAPSRRCVCQFHHTSANQDLTADTTQGWTSGI
jgi:hypothetical protein